MLNMKIVGSPTVTFDPLWCCQISQIWQGNLQKIIQPESRRMIYNTENFKPAAESVNKLKAALESCTRRQGAINTNIHKTESAL